MLHRRRYFAWRLNVYDNIFFSFNLVRKNTQPSLSLRLGRCALGFSSFQKSEEDEKRNSASALKRYQEAVAALSGKILPPWRLQNASVGKGTTDSGTSASCSLEALAKGRTPSEMTLLANQYYQGFGVTQDKELATKLWFLAARQGNLDARYSYAMAVRQGEGGIDPNPAKAAALLEEVLEGAGATGHGYAEHALAVLLAEGEGGVDKDERRALELLQSAALKGVVPAIKKAADMVSQGRGRGKSEELAVKWYEMGAEAGDPACMVALAQLYSAGKYGLPKDLEKAFALNMQAASMNHLKAQHNLGVQYMHGQGCKKDFYQASLWFRKAAEKGFGPSQTNLGNMYKKGLGVDQSDDEAECWHNKAIESEDRHGIQNTT